MTMPIIVRISEAIAKIKFLLNFMKSQSFEGLDFAEFFHLYVRIAKVQNNLLASHIWSAYRVLKFSFQSDLAFDLQTRWTKTVPIDYLVFQIEKMVTKLTMKVLSQSVQGAI